MKHPHSPDHRAYLAAALAATAFTSSRRAHLVSAYDTWAQCIEACTEFSGALYDRWRRDGIEWGEDFDQYDVLDRIAELWLAWACKHPAHTQRGATATPDPTVIIMAALIASREHEKARRQQEPQS
jgi:hypothetical protein